MRSNKPIPRLGRRLLYSTALLGGTLLLAAEAGAQNLPDTNPGTFTTATTLGTPGSQPLLAPNGTNPATELDISLRDTRTIITWNNSGTGFNIADGFGVNFVDGRGGPTDNIAVLNRDLSGGMSTINGNINGASNIAVYLINPNGILFGPSGSVNVGALIASSLDVDAANQTAFLNSGSSLTFAGAAGATAAVTVNGKTLTASAASGLGELVFLGPAVSMTGATLTGGGDVAIVAGTDITMSNPGSPLSFTINQGTTVNNAVMVGATIGGRNVTFAAARPSALLDTLLTVSGVVTATGAAASDRGIVLLGGQSGPGVTVTSPSDNIDIDASGATFDSNTDATFVTGGDLNIGSTSVDRNYSVTAANFLGNSLAPTLNGTGSDFTITDTALGLTVGALTAPGTLGITTQNGGALTVNGNLTSTNEGIALNGSGGIALNGIALSSAGSQTLTGATVVAGSTSATASGAGSTITFNDTVDGGGTLATSSSGGTVFNGDVGATTPLASLTVTGPTTLNAGSILTSGGIGLGALTVGASAPATVTLDAGAGALTASGAILAAVPDANALSLSGSSIAVGNVGVGGRFASVIFNDPTTLTGDVNAAGAVQFVDSLSLSGAGLRKVTGGSASFQAVSSSVAGTTGLSVDAGSGAATFNSPIGAGGALSALAVRAGSAGFSGNNFVGTLAADVTSGGIAFTNGQALTIGTVDGLSGITADAGAIGISTTGATSDLAVAGPVTATAGTVTLTSSRDLTGAGAISAGGAGNDATLSASAGSINLTGTVSAAGDVSASALHAVTLTGLVTSGVDIAINSGGTIGTGALTAQDDIVLRSTGATATGALTSGLGADAAGAGDTLAGAALVGGDVDAVANGLTAGAVRANGAGSDIRLSGGAGGIGTGAQDLDLGAGGSIVLTGAARGRDVALNAGGTISTGAISARDDIAARAVGSASFGALTSGTIVDSLPALDIGGAADTLLPSANLIGHDIDLAANGLVVGAVQANGAGSDVRLDGGAGGIGNGAQDFSISTQGDIVLTGSTRGLDVALNAGGSITTGAISARDDIAARAVGSATFGALTSGTTIDSLGPTDTSSAGAADTLVGAALAGNDVDLAANGLIVGAVRANGAGSDIRLDGGAGGIGHGAQDLDLIAGGDIALTGTARGLDVALSAGGAITAGAVSARDDIAARAVGAATFGSLTSGTIVDSLPPADTAGAADALLPAADFTGHDVDLAANGLQVGIVRANGASSDVRLDGGATGTGTLGANLDVGADGDIEILNDARGLNVILDAGDDITAAQLTSANDTTLTAGDVLTLSVAAAVGQDLTMTAADFLGLTLASTPGDDLTITDTAGGLVLPYALTVPGLVTVTVQNGGSLTVNAPLASVHEEIALATAGGGDIALNADLTTGTGAGRSVTLVSSGAIAQAGATGITTNTLAGSAVGIASLSGDNALLNFGPFTAASLNLNDLGGLTVAGAVTTASGVSIGTSGTLNVNAPVSGGAGPASLTASGAGSDINLAANVTTATTLTLNAGGNIVQSAGSIAASTLTGSSGGSTTLGSGGNQVATLGAFSANGFALTDDGGLTVAGAVAGGGGGVSIDTSGTLTVAGTGSVTAANAPIALTATGAASDIALDGPVNAGTGVVTLTAGQHIGQGNLGVVTAGTLTGSSGGNTNLASLTNQIANLGPFTAVSFALLDAGGLTVTGTVAAPGGIGLETSGNLVLNAPVNAGTGTATLTATGGGAAIGQSAAGIVTAGTLTGSSTGPTNLTAALNAVGNLGAFTSDGFAFRNDPALVVTGPVNAGSGALSLEVVADPVTINGNLTGQGMSVKAAGVTQAAASTVNAGSGTILIDADDGAISLAGSLTTTNSGANAVAIVDSGNAVLGNITTGAGGMVTLGGAGADLLNGSVGQTAGTAIVAGTLTGNAAGAVTLANAGNQLDFLSTFTSNGFSLRDASGGLIVNGHVDAGTGYLSLRVDAGNLILADNLTAAGTVAVDTLAGSIAQTGGRIAASTLTGSSSGSTSLNSATNAVSNLAAFTAGTDFSFVDSIALTVTGPVTATTGDLTITAPGIAFAGQTLTAGDDVTLNALGGALAGGTVVAGDDLSGLGASVAVTSASAVDIALRGTAGAVSAGTLTARDDIALRATGAIGVTTATSGATIGSSGPTDTAGVADALVAATLAGNDINAVGDSAAFGTATATGAASDLTVVAQTGALTLGTGNAGATATLTKSGALAELQVTNSLTTGNGSANGHATLSSATNARLASVDSRTGNVTVTATGDATGGTLQAAGNTNVAAGPLAQFTLVAGGNNVAVSAGSVLVGTATATNGSLALTASSGQLTLGTGSAGTIATLTKTGSAGELQVTNSLTSGTAAANGDATVTTSTSARLGTVDSRTGSVLVNALNGSVTGAPLGTPAADGRPAAAFGGANLLAATAGRDVTVRAGGAHAQLGTVTAGRTGRIEANELELLGAVTAPTVEIVNRGAGGSTRLGDGLAAAAGLNLSQAEVNRIAAPSLTVDSAARNVEIGNLAFAAAAGSAQLNLLGTARFDVTGQVTTTQAANSRTVQIGGTAANAGEASVIRVAATPAAGGRLLMGNSLLQLRGQKIGVGQDSDFLAAIGLVPGGTPASQATVNADYIGNSGSRLYNPSQPYSNNTILTAHQLSVTYTDYALFQNTALPGLLPQGAIVGTLGVQQTLALNSSGAAAPNGFALFGEVSGRQGVEAALLGPNFIALNGANPNNTRINGCLVGSGAGGCLISAFSTPPVTIFGDSQAALLSAEGDLPLTFDPVVGANNEALFSGLSSVDSILAEPVCEPGPESPDCPDEKEDPK